MFAELNNHEVDDLVQIVLILVGLVSLGLAVAAGWANRFVAAGVLALIGVVVLVLAL